MCRGCVNTWLKKPGPNQVAGLPGQYPVTAACSFYIVVIVVVASASPGFSIILLTTHANCQFRKTNNLSLSHFYSELLFWGFQSPISASKCTFYYYLVLIVPIFSICLSGLSKNNGLKKVMK